jgi:PAS domain S-box-containing protein
MKDAQNISGISKNELLRLLRVYQQAIDLNIICSITDTLGNIIYVNRKFCEISQYSEVELLGQNHRIVKSGHHDKKFFKRLWDTITQGKIWQGEVKSKAKDGSFFWQHSVILPVRNDKDDIIQYFSLRFPIDEKIKAEEERKQHMKSLEEMLFMISHKVRQPVANILGLSDMLLKYAHSPEEQLNMLRLLNESAQSLDSFTTELTEFIYKIEHTEGEITTTI